jgi:hypothetical protein
MTSGEAGRVTVLQRVGAQRRVRPEERNQRKDGTESSPSHPFSVPSYSRLFTLRLAIFCELRR